MCDICRTIDPEVPKELGTKFKNIEQISQVKHFDKVHLEVVFIQLNKFIEELLAGKWDQHIFLVNFMT